MVYGFESLHPHNFLLYLYYYKYVIQEKIIMKKYLEFFKLNGIWYADIPENTLEETEMLLGSDEFLEMVVGDCKRVAMDLVTDECDDYLVKLTLTSHDEMGGEYSMSGKLIDKFEKEGNHLL